MEDLVASIDAPIKDMGLAFFNDVVFDAPQLVQFISRTPTLKSLEKACLLLRKDFGRVMFSSQTSNYGGLRVEIMCNGLEWQVSFM